MRLATPVLVPPLIRTTLLALLSTIWLGCAIPKLPQGQPAGPVAEQTYLRVKGLYLRPQELDGRVMAGALEAFEKRFDPIRFERNGHQGVLEIGDHRVTIPIDLDPDPEEFLATLGGVLEYVQTQLGPQVEEELQEDENLEILALRGALRALDRYSTIYSGKGTQDFQIRFSGQLEGIGSRIGRRDGDLVAIKVFPGGPAEKGGMQDGDAIVAIDGEPTRPMTVAEAVIKIRGPANSPVLLSVRREEDEQEEEFDFTITRGKVRVPTVEAEELAPGFGYARILQVSRSTPAEFREKVDALGALKGLVLDLRSNSGGSMLASARLADFFLPSGTIVKTVGREGVAVAGLRSRARATRRVLYKFPVVVLIDSSTASAAEILTGAIAPLRRVTLVGQTTFGKGLVQRIYPLPDENLLKLTVAEYQLSKNRAIHLEGIDPDFELFSVTGSVIAPLANVPPGALPYLRRKGEEDRFPIEVGQAILELGLEAGTASKLEESEAAIAEHLTELGVEWSKAEPLPELLDRSIRIEVTAPELEAGKESKARITVENPNPFAIPDAWATLAGPIEELSKVALSLGTIPAHGEATVEVVVTLPDGLSAGELPFLVHVASRLRPIGSLLTVLRAREHIPELEIEVVRSTEDETVHVTLRNRAETGAGKVRIDVSGAFRVIEELPAGAEETVELPLSGKAKNVSITMIGPLADRRLEIPLPESSVTIIPPRIRVRRVGIPGFDRIRVQASDPEGLQEGWISLDGEKKSYADWEGKRSGSLTARLSHGEQAVVAKVETASGLSVYDRRVFTTD